MPAAGHEHVVLEDRGVGLVALVAAGPGAVAVAVPAGVLLARVLGSRACCGSRRSGRRGGVAVAVATPAATVAPAALARLVGAVLVRAVLVAPVLVSGCPGARCWWSSRSWPSLRPGWPLLLLAVLLLAASWLRGRRPAAGLLRLLLAAVALLAASLPAGRRCCWRVLLRRLRRRRRRLLRRLLRRARCSPAATASACCSACLRGWRWRAGRCLTCGGSPAPAARILGWLPWRLAALGLGRLDRVDELRLLHGAGAGDAHAGGHRLEVGDQHGVESATALLRGVRTTPPVLRWWSRWFPSREVLPTYHCRPGPRAVGCLVMAPPTVGTPPRGEGHDGVRHRCARVRGEGAPRDGCHLLTLCASVPGSGRPGTDTSDALRA